MENNVIIEVLLRYFTWSCISGSLEDLTKISLRFTVLSELFVG